MKYLILTLLLAGCATPHYLPHRPTWESYDQANLKALAPTQTTGCPGVYDAPNGELRFCL